MSAMLWERRRFFRIPVAGRALLQHGEKLDGLYDVENLSIGGCMIKRGPKCKLGDAVGLTLHVDGDAEIALAAKVVRSESAPGGSTLGLCFIDIDSQFEDRVQDLVMRAIERQQRGEILVVHAHPERLTSLFDSMREIGHSVVTARTPRDAFVMLERDAERVRMAIVAHVVGASSARDIVKLILRRFPHVHCVMLSRGGADRLVRAIRSAEPEPPSPWSLVRLRNVIAKHEVVMVASA